MKKDRDEHERTEAPPVFTIGHSTRSIAEFVTLLQAGHVELVIDIRRIPRSRTNPQFNPEILPAALQPWQIGYTAIAELGGRRSKAHDIPPEVNGYWTNQSFHNYADYALSREFDLGLRRLLKLSQHCRSAIMCSEAVWWRCHRRIVADYLLFRGRSVFHLMAASRVETAVINSAAREEGNALVYPAEIVEPRATTAPSP
jgi:uncharacterized protein (DUF488 family)